MTRFHPVASLNRRRVVQIGTGAVIASLLGIRPASARQDSVREFTFIVAGLDYREGFDEHNTDVLMVSRVNLDIGTVRTVSIPRDLYVDIPGIGLDKITRAFHFGYYNSGETWDGGAQLLADTIAHNLDLTIDGVVTTTFVGFEAIIDALGGLEVDNPYEVEGFGNYPSFSEGVQTLSGEAALVFVRTRSQDGDNGRVMRQQIVLETIFDELQKPEVVTELPRLVSATRDAVETNIPMGIQLSLLTALPGLRRDNIHFSTITEYLAGGVIDNGMWVYQADWRVIPGVVQGFLNGE